LAAWIGPYIRPYALGLEIIPFWIVSVFLCSMVFYFVFGFALSKFQSGEQSYAVPLIEMTVGDQRRVERFSLRIVIAEKRMNFWVISVGLTFAMSVIASLFVIFVN
jgi:hypothetical protein